MNARKKEVMTVTASVYKLTQRFSELRVEAQELEEGDPRDEDITEQMNMLAGAIAVSYTHLTLPTICSV